MSNNAQSYDDGNDSEEDEPFNPYQDAGSDDEGVKRQDADADAKPQLSDGGYDDDEQAGGEDDDAKPATERRSRPRDDQEGDEDEDAEGDGEDLGQDDEDDEEDEEDEDDEVMDRPRKRHKRDRARNQFIDAEAEVDEEEEEDEDDEDEVADETHPDDLLEAPTGTENDDRRHRELDRQRERAENIDAEKAAARFEEKYSGQRRNLGEVSAIPQHLLLPSVNDPTIWAVKCKPTKENELVAEMYRKWELRQRSRDPLKMFSAFARSSSTMTGYIYVEAPTLQDVYNCTDDILGIYAHMKDGARIIPISERPDTLRTIKPKQLERGNYVRLKRPAKYMGDLAIIEEVGNNGIDVTIKFVPRIDYGDDDIGVGKRKRPTSSRPPQRLFSEHEARRRAPRSLIPGMAGGRKEFQFQNERFIDGFMIKDVRTATLQTVDVNPTLEEVQVFASSNGEDGPDNLDLTQLAATLKASTAASTFVPGDNVEIYQGEQSGVKGHAISVSADIVTLKVSEGPLRGQTLEAPMKTLRKLFREGDHVRVIGGNKYFDEAGMIVRIKDDRVTIITDANNAEITVFSRDLRAATASTASRMAMKHNFDLHDLVQLDATTVGCIVKVDRETVRVLDQNSEVRTVLPSQIANKLEKRRHTVATDRDGSEVKAEDNIREYAGQNRQGTVLHVHRNWLFAQSTGIAENNGVFVVRSGNVNNLGAKKSGGLDLTKMNPALMRGASNGGSGMMAPPRPMGKDQLDMKTVKIKLGPYKGLIGIVKGQVGEDSARVELHSKNKIITVPKASLMVVDPKTGEPLGPRGPPGARGPMGGSFPSRTPGRVPDFAGGRTPMGASGARTPWGASGGAGGMTPSANRTPWHNRPTDGGRTPAYGDGSRTAYGGDGSRTSYGGATSYGGSTAYGGYSGSRTPAAAGQTSRQPYNAPTPGMYGSAATPGIGQTPGAYESAPTPFDGGYQGAPTPGGGYAYGTPAASAMTPGAYAAPTPAAGGDDDGPRYD